MMIILKVIARNILILSVCKCLILSSVSFFSLMMLHQVHPQGPVSSFFKVLLAEGVYILSVYIQ